MNLRGLNSEHLIKNYKTQRCTIQEKHDTSACHMFHEGEPFRRDPLVRYYRPSPCLSHRSAAGCSDGSECVFAHGSLELGLHPERFRTRLCTNPKCRRHFCTFAHGSEELRQPSKSPAAKTTNKRVIAETAKKFEVDETEDAQMGKKRKLDPSNLVVRQQERVKELKRVQDSEELMQCQKQIMRDIVCLELQRLETSNDNNVGNILSALGLDVGNQGPQEMSTAFRKGFIKFHPDKNMNANLQTKVECEEKCKLLNRLKEDNPQLF